MEDEKNLNPQEETNLEDKKEDIKAEEAPTEETTGAIEEALYEQRSLYEHVINGGRMNILP